MNEELWDIKPPYIGGDELWQTPVKVGDIDEGRGVISNGFSGG